MTLIFDNVRVFDGRAAELTAPTRVAVEDSLISAVDADDRSGTVIDGGGRVLMPGLIDAHWHAMMASLPMAQLATADLGYITLAAGREAERTLLRGFTTVRDAGGPSFGLKRAIDEGLIRGPRIFPSGAFISQTSGHGDFRTAHDLPKQGLTFIETSGVSAIADGVDEVLRAAREQLMLGASQLKLMAGGGVASPHDPLDVTQYTEGELRAAVEAAENWGTYVMVHAYTPRSVQQAIRAGVRCIEHGHLLDDETAAQMATQEVWWCLQPFLDDEEAIPMTDPVNRAKQLTMVEGTDRAYELARKHGVRVAWGTDTLFDPQLATRQGAQLAKMTRWFTQVEVLRMATSGNAELLAMSGERNPYPRPLGVIEPGAYADLLLVDGDPLTDLTVLADPANLVVIMKNGEIVRDARTP
ncbi:MAG: amidohydrolase family protein [Hamadaea sp.]|uniref:metal-dependent hydrolase family protein n=1 Tax=Hamadaea sp. TaxID=2024425 RepID=UPI00182C139F|nr:amidohydrolase family protein [Hamadaea sp.]NUR70107.1 amidohydrolase family protein [Hamadaea sp.]NUT21441.1 amidohydrolase family protein [Hamadaea sp.]